MKNSTTNIKSQKTIYDYKKLIARENKKINFINIISSIVMCILLTYSIIYPTMELCSGITSDSTFFCIMLMSIILSSLVYGLLHFVFIEKIIDKYRKNIKYYNYKIDELIYEHNKNNEELKRWYKSYYFWRNYEFISKDFEDNK